MPGEFTKRVVDNKNIWNCNRCKEDIVSTAKPRSHVCREQEQESNPTTDNPTTSSPRGSHSVPNSPYHQYRTNFSGPPPGFNGQHPGFQSQSAEMDALLRFQMLQADQTKQMMMFLQQQNQEMHKNQQEQTELKINQMMEILKIQKQTETKVKCPRWEKEENVNNFLNRLKRWNDVEKGKGKYLQLLEALLDSGRKSEKQRIELEEQNGLIDPENENIIKDIIEKMQKWFGKTKVDEASDTWRTFRDMKRSKEENIDKFLLRFETVESKLKCSAVELPNLILALQLLESVNVNTDQRRSILVHVKVENVDTVYEDMKSSMRLLKGNLVEGKSNSPSETLIDDEINFSRNDNFRSSRSRSKSKSFADRTFDKQNKREERSNSRGRNRERKYSNDRTPFRRNSYSRNRDYSRDNRNRDNRRDSRNRDNSRDSRNRDYSRDRYYKGRDNNRSYENGEELLVEEKDNVGKMIVDSGTTKTVDGEEWMKNYLEYLSDEERKKC